MTPRLPVVLVLVGAASVAGVEGAYFTRRQTSVRRRLLVSAGGGEFRRAPASGGLMPTPDWRTPVPRRFLRSLLDLSFTTFVTTKLVKVLYALSLAAAVLVYVGVAFVLFTAGAGDSVTLAADGSLQSHSSGSTGLALAWLFLIGPLFLLFQALAARVLSELVIVLFRIFESTRDQLALTRAAIVAAGEEPSPAA